MDYKEKLNNLHKTVFYEKFIGQDESCVDIKSRKKVRKSGYIKLYRTDWNHGNQTPLVTHDKYTGSNFILGTNAKREEAGLGMHGICNDRICGNSSCNSQTKTTWFKSPTPITLLSADGKMIYRGLLMRCPSCGNEYADIDTEFRASDKYIKMFGLDKTPNNL